MEQKEIINQLDQMETRLEISIALMRDLRKDLQKEIKQNVESELRKKDLNSESKNIQRENDIKKQ